MTLSTQGRIEELKLVLYFADGFGWHYLQGTGFLADEWTAVRPLESVLGYSSTIIPCLLSGHLPRDTGMFTEYYYSPRRQTRVERALCAVGPIRTLADMARLVLFRIARKRGMPAAHELRISLRFAHLFKRHPIDYRRFPPIKLNVPTIADLFDELGLAVEVRYLETGPPLPEEVDRVRRLAPERDIFVFFDSSIDARGHRTGALTSAVQPQIDQVGAFLADVWDALGVADGERELLLYSDHGMATVDQAYDVIDTLRDFRVGTDYLVFLDSTMARFWFPSAENKERVLAALSAVPGRVLTDADRVWAGIDFEDDRYGQVIIVANEGTVFHPSYISPTFFRTRFPDRGTHGYWPTEPSTFGVFAYRGSRLSKHLVPDPVPAVGLFGAVSAIVGYSPRDQDPAWIHPSTEGPAERP